MFNKLNGLLRNEDFKKIPEDEKYIEAESDLKKEVTSFEESFGTIQGVEDLNGKINLLSKLISDIDSFMYKNVNGITVEDPSIWGSHFMDPEDSKEKDRVFKLIASANREYRDALKQQQEIKNAKLEETVSGLEAKVAKYSNLNRSVEVSSTQEHLEQTIFELKQIAQFSYFLYNNFDFDNSETYGIKITNNNPDLSEEQLSRLQKIIEISNSALPEATEAKNKFYRQYGLI
jgi:hypothetical protein